MIDEETMAETLSVMENVRHLIAEIILAEGTIKDYENVAVVMARVSEIEMKLLEFADSDDFDEDDDSLDTYGEKIIYKDLNKKEAISDEVAMAVMHGIQAASEGSYKEHHTDSIEFAIIKYHGNPNKKIETQ